MRNMERTKMSKKTTIIFDLDGTLLYTLEDLKDAVNYALRTKGYAEHNLEEMRQFFGNGIRYALAEAEPAATEEDLDELIRLFKTYYAGHLTDKTVPYDGIMDLLETLYEEGYKMAIVSNKVDEAVKTLAEHFFGKYVTVAIGNSDRIRRKPAPDTVFAAMEELGVTAEESVYVGDSEVDLATARAAGIPCITVLWGFRDREFLISHGAKVFAENPEDLFSLITT
jgi:phosphoglycolate phosphatase